MAFFCVEIFFLNGEPLQQIIGLALAALPWLGHKTVEIRKVESDTAIVPVAEGQYCSEDLPMKAVLISLIWITEFRVRHVVSTPLIQSQTILQL